MILSAAFGGGMIFCKTEIMLYIVKWRCINKNHSERNQIHVDIVPNFARNNGKKWYER